MKENTVNVKEALAKLLFKIQLPISNTKIEANSLTIELLQGLLQAPKSKKKKVKDPQNYCQWPFFVTLNEEIAFGVLNVYEGYTLKKSITIFKKINS